MTPADHIAAYRSGIRAHSQFGHDIPLTVRGTFHFVKMVTEMLTSHKNADSWKMVSGCHLFADMFEYLDSLAEKKELKKKDGRFGFPVLKDGKLYKLGGPHSWLETINGNYIIDVMPVGVYGGPRLYSQRPGSNIGQYLFHLGEPEILERIAKIRAEDSYKQALEAIRTVGEEVQRQIGEEMDKRTD